MTVMAATIVELLTLESDDLELMLRFHPESRAALRMVGLITNDCKKRAADWCNGWVYVG